MFRLHNYQKNSLRIVQGLRDKHFIASGISTSNLNLEKLNKRVYCLTLRRNEGKNSFSKEMVSDFNAAINSLRGLSNDEAATVLILRSTVDRVFCAGADLKERLSMPEDQIASFVSSLRVSMHNWFALSMFSFCSF
jgi:methylglutaconyl-CoA hydratase